MTAKLGVPCVAGAGSVRVLLELWWMAYGWKMAEVLLNKRNYLLIL